MIITPTESEITFFGHDPAARFEISARDYANSTKLYQASKLFEGWYIDVTWRSLLDDEDGITESEEEMAGMFDCFYWERSSHQRHELYLSVDWGMGVAVRAIKSIKLFDSEEDWIHKSLVKET